MENAVGQLSFMNKGKTGVLELHKIRFFAGYFDTLGESCIIQQITNHYRKSWWKLVA